MTPDFGVGADADTVTMPTSGTPSTHDADSAIPSGASSAPDIDLPESPPTSEHSTPRSLGSKRHYERPRTVRALAAQVADLATAVLNGEVEGDALEAARVYASLTRTTAQLVSAEVTRARFLRMEPNLSLEGDDDD